MANPKQTLIKTYADLSECQCRFALIGALAVGVRSTVRTTKDVDLAVAVDSDQYAEKIVLNLQNKGYMLHSVLEHKPSGRLATARLCIPASTATHPDLDLLFCSSGVEQEIVLAAQPIKFLGMDIAVAKLGHLLALKVLAFDDDRRPQDKIDIMALLSRADQSDIAEAVALAKLMTKRRFNRGKNLSKDIQSFVRIAEKIKIKNKLVEV